MKSTDITDILFTLGRRRFRPIQTTLKHSPCFRLATELSPKKLTGPVIFLVMSRRQAVKIAFIAMMTIDGPNISYDLHVKQTVPD